MTPIICKYCKNIPNVIVPQLVVSGPAKGVCISKSWIVCKCGWQTPKFKTATQAIILWNKIMESKYVK